MSLLTHVAGHVCDPSLFHKNQHVHLSITYSFSNSPSSFSSSPSCTLQSPGMNVGVVKPKQAGNYIPDGWRKLGEGEQMLVQVEGTEARKNGREK